MARLQSRRSSTPTPKGARPHEEVKGSDGPGPDVPGCTIMDTEVDRALSEEHTMLRRTSSEANKMSVPLSSPQAKPLEQVSAEKPTFGGAGGVSSRAKWGVLAFLVFQNSGASLLMHESRAAGSNPQTAVIMQEVIKGVLCIFLVLQAGGLPALREVFRPNAEALKTSVPALLYLFQNNMQYVAVGHLDAATYAVLYQMKILTAGVMSVIILRKPLSLLQWLALFLLTVGASIVIVSQMTGSSKDRSDQNVAIGVVSVILACLSSGFAGVYWEKLLKGSTLPLWSRNLQLAAYSLLVGLPGFFTTDGWDRLGLKFFDGFTPVVWLAVVNNALGGLLIAVVIKYADTILKNFSTTLSIIFTMGFSVMVFGQALKPMSIFGTSLVIYAVFLYAGMTGRSLLRWPSLGLRKTLSAGAKE